MNASSRAQPLVLHLVASNIAKSIPLEMAAHIRQQGFDLHAVAYYRAAGPPAVFQLPVTEIGARGPLDRSAARALYHMIRSLRPDVIHVHHTLPAVLGSLFGRLLGAPALIDTEHNDHAGFTLGQRLLNLVTLAMCDAVVCNSRNTCRSFSWWERAAAAGKRLVIYNGVNVGWLDRCATDREAVRKRYGLGAQDFVIGNVGRLVRQKDQQSLIRAMEPVIPRLPQAKLVVVGEGPLHEELEALVQQLGLQRHVVLTGNLARQEVYELLHAIDLFVMCSQWEGFCNALVEAMAIGKPFVATHVGPLPEVTGGLGRLVPPHSPAALAEAIVELSSAAPGELERLGQAARQRVVENFTVQRTAEQYGQLYRRLLAEKGVAG